VGDIFKYIREFYHKEFNAAYFFVILLLVGSMIYLNYWHSLEAKYAGGGSSKWGHFLGYYLLYFIPFAAAFFLQPIFLKDCTYFKSIWFWIILLGAPAFFSFRINFDLHQAIISKQWSNNDEAQFFLRCSNWIVRVIVVLIPVVIIWFIKDRGNQPFYGTRALGNIKPYLIMLAIMIPLIALASTQQDFLNMYPKSKFLQYTSLAQQKWRYVVYELCYGFDFVSIEFFFRGFLILALLNVCGTHSIIPVACFYCSIHLGKPMGEAISSFFGGTLLGIVCYNTGSVWGGLIIHLGIAWFMEIGGWLGALVKLKK
jgi:hypothetical protein